MTNDFGEWNDPVGCELIMFISMSSLTGGPLHLWSVRSGFGMGDLERCCQELQGLYKLKWWDDTVISNPSNWSVISVISLRSFSCSDIVKKFFGSWWKWLTSQGVHSKWSVPCTNLLLAAIRRGCGYLPSGSICEVQCKVGCPDAQDLEDRQAKRWGLLLVSMFARIRNPTRAIPPLPSVQPTTRYWACRWTGSWHSVGCCECLAASWLVLGYQNFSTDVWQVVLLEVSPTEIPEDKSLEEWTPPNCSFSECPYPQNLPEGYTRDAAGAVHLLVAAYRFNVESRTRTSSFLLGQTNGNKEHLCFSYSSSQAVTCCGVLERDVAPTPPLTLHRQCLLRTGIWRPGTSLEKLEDGFLILDRLLLKALKRSRSHRTFVHVKWLESLTRVVIFAGVPTRRCSLSGPRCSLQTALEGCHKLQPCRLREENKTWWLNELDRPL